MSVTTNKQDQEDSDFLGFDPDDTESFFTSVLLIEDEHAHASLIKRALKGVVGEVFHAPTVKEGFELLENEYIELVFCDLHLPDASGLEIIRGLQARRRGRPIIVLTGSSRLDDAVTAMREGAWDYMVKEFSDDFAQRLRLTVVRTMEKCLQQTREMKVRQERNAFWIATNTARDGLAVLTDEGSIVFENEAFSNFKRLVSPGGAPRSLVEIVSSTDSKLAQALTLALKDNRSDLLWESELSLPRLEEAREASHSFELRLSTASSASLTNQTSDAVPQIRYKVLWVRDISRRKEQERFQRDLLSTTTHDLKGPLSAILTSAELLTDYHCQDDEKAKSLLTRVGSCARNAISIIDELLSARRIQDGVMVLRPRWQNVSEVLEDVLLDYQPIARSKSIDFQVIPVSQEMELFADKMGLARVLGNLVSNALKFTSPGGKVSLSAERLDAEVRLSVSDTGPGIDTKVQHKLFQRFARLERDSEVEGTGIGLFVTKNIMEAHAGRIEVSSTLTVGTTFVMIFPDGPKMHGVKEGV